MTDEMDPVPDEVVAAARAAFSMGSPLDPDVEVGMLLGWCDGAPENVEATKRQTHDGLIKLMGMRRRGVVSWHIIRSDQGALAVIGMILADDAADDPTAKYYREIQMNLSLFGGTLVIASAPAGGNPRSN